LHAVRIGVAARCVRKPGEDQRGHHRGAADAQRNIGECAVAVIATRARAGGNGPRSGRILVGGCCRPIGARSGLARLLHHLFRDAPCDELVDRSLFLGTARSGTPNSLAQNVGCRGAAAG